MDRVIFRRWNKKNGGGIIAILLDNTANVGMTDMYEHIGQHGEGSYSGVLSQTKLAKPKEYRDLMIELQSLGYEPRIVKRWNQRRLNE